MIGVDGCRTHTNPSHAAHRDCQVDVVSTLASDRSHGHSFNVSTGSRAGARPLAPATVKINAGGPCYGHTLFCSTIKCSVSGTRSSLVSA
jgi:hypothetical protein